MSAIQCQRCGCKEIKVEKKGSQTGAYCCDCGRWIKWVSKKDERDLVAVEPQKRRKESEWVRFRYYVQCRNCDFVTSEGLENCPQCKAKMKNAGVKSLAAAEEGRHVPVYLPCSPETTLYTTKAEKIGRGKWIEKVVKIEIDHFVVSGFDGSVSVFCCDDDNRWYQFTREDFGDSAFFSEEEARRDIDGNTKGKREDVPF